MASDVEGIIMCLLAICVLFLVEYLFRYLAHFKIRLFAFLLLSCTISSCILDTSTLSCFVKTSSLGFHFLDGVLWSEKVLNFVACAIGVLSNHCLIQSHLVRSLIHFEVIFLYGMK